jgi:large subunit ribosomal protein L13
MTNYTIDAEGKALGRVASEAAAYLIGKSNVSFVKNVAPNVSVTITNAGKTFIRESKALTSIYQRYSGYPGGLKSPTLKDVIAKKGIGEAYKLTIKGMLPKNKLQTKMLSHLKVVE